MIDVYRSKWKVQMSIYFGVYSHVLYVVIPHCFPKATRHYLNTTDGLGHWRTYGSHGLDSANKSWRFYHFPCHHSDVIMGTMASQITNPTIVYLTVYSGADQRKHQRPASLAFMGTHWWPVNSPHKGPALRKFDRVTWCSIISLTLYWK